MLRKITDAIKIRGKRVEASRTKSRGTRERQRGLVVTVEKDAIIFTSYSKSISLAGWKFFPI